MGSAQILWRVHEREGKKGGLKEREVAWTGTPKIYDRSPPLKWMNGWMDGWVG